MKALKNKAFRMTGGGYFPENTHEGRTALG